MPITDLFSVLPTSATRIESDASGFEYMAVDSSDESARWQSGVHDPQGPAHWRRSPAGGATAGWPGSPTDFSEDARSISNPE